MAPQTRGPPDRPDACASTRDTERVTAARAPRLLGECLELGMRTPSRIGVLRASLAHIPDLVHALRITVFPVHLRQQKGVALATPFPGGWTAGSVPEPFVHAGHVREFLFGVTRQKAVIHVIDGHEIEVVDPEHHVLVSDVEESAHLGHDADQLAIM